MENVQISVLYLSVLCHWLLCFFPHAHVMTWITGPAAQKLATQLAAEFGLLGCGVLGDAKYIRGKKNHTRYLSEKMYVYKYIYIYGWSQGIPRWYVEIAEDFYVFLLSNFWPAGPIQIVGRSGMDYPILYRLVCVENGGIGYAPAILGIGNVYM